MAKAFQPDASDPNMSQSPTVSLTAAATELGMVIGTAAYMAPEQAKGKVVDKRADVWAFGAVLFEMLTGSKAFAGETVSETLADVMKSEPRWDALPADLPPALSNLVRRCLEKDPTERVRDIGDVRLAMKGAFETTPSAPATLASVAQRHLWQRAVPLVLAGLALLLIGGLSVWALTRPAPDRVVRFTMPLAGDLIFSGTGRPMVAVAPPGDRVAFTAGNGLWLRPLDQMDATLVSGSEGARNPFFSADGRWLGFWADDQLKRVSVSGGAPVALGAAENPFGASWGADDTILFGQSNGIWRVPGTGGTPERVISIEDGEAVHGPQLLPGGDVVLFTLRPAGTLSWDASQIVVQSLAGGERTVLIDGGQDARYVSTGHLVYALDGALLAQVYDLDQRMLRGGPVPLVEGVRTVRATTGAVMFSVSGDGALVYVPDSGADDRQSLVWVDREGNEEPLAADPNLYESPRVSPDGRYVAVQVDSPEDSSSGALARGRVGDVLVYDLARDTLGRVSFDPGDDGAPMWTPDGQRLVFSSNRDGGAGNLYARAADGTGQAERLTTSDTQQTPSSWSADGQTLVLNEVVPGNVTITTVSLGDSSQSRLLIDSPGSTDAYPEVSPNGRWIAYHSNESGEFQVYVRPFPNVDGGRWQISSDGGFSPVWGRDGRELFFRSLSFEMRVVAYEDGQTFRPGTSQPLFPSAQYLRVFPTRVRPFDLAPDGRFLMIRSLGGEAASPQINVVLNWDKELLERVPVP